jgi:putative addiction module killer protein
VDTIKPFRLAETAVFSRWLGGLKDHRAKAAIVFRLRQVAAGHLGDVKSVGGGVSELRWHIGPGYLVYFTRRGQQIILLLAGGDKSSQTQDIAKAQKLAKDQLKDNPDEQNH